MKRFLRSILLTLLLVTASSALAHATLVFGELSTPHDPPDAASGFTLELHMMDPVRTPIEDAIVSAEFRLLSDEELAALEAEEPAGEDAGPTEGVHAEELELPEGDWHVYRMEETGPGGNYAAQVTLPESGVYQLIMRDTTYPQEDAVAELIVALDGATELGEALFIFPPTDIGTASLSTWLIWLVAVPIVAAIVVTITVMSSKPGKEATGGKPS